MIDEYNRIIRGVGTYGNPVIHGNLSKIYVGKYCSISDNAFFDAGFNHDTSFISTYPFNQKMDGCEHLNNLHPISFGDTAIKNDVWIGDNAFIRSGIEISDGAIIGFGAVITKNVRPYAVMVGNPAREAKRRYSDAIIETLLLIQWWDWSPEKIKENAHLLMSNRIDEFIKLHL